MAMPQIVKTDTREAGAANLGIERLGEGVGVNRRSVLSPKHEIVLLEIRIPRLPLRPLAVSMQAEEVQCAAVEVDDSGLVRLRG